MIRPSAWTPLTLLRTARTGRLWASQALSSVGDQLYVLALLALATAHFGAQAGLVLAVQTVSEVLGSLLGGALADRLDRGRTLMLTDAVRALAVLSLAAAAALDRFTLAQACGVALLLGGASALFSPTFRSGLPGFTTTEQLPALNALMDVGGRLARILGPALGAAVLAILPVWHLFILDALTFAASATALWSLRAGFSAPLDRPASSLWQDLSAAGRWMLSGTAPKVLIASAALASCCWGSVFVVGLALVARSAWHGLSDYGWLVSAYGVGNVAANLWFSTRLPRQRLRTVLLGNLVFSVGMAGAVLSPGLAAAAPWAVLAAMGGPLMDLSASLFVQQDVPAALRGKVFGLLQLGEGVGLSVGLAAAPLLVNLTSAHLGLLLPLFALTLFSGAALPFAWTLNQPDASGVLSTSPEEN